jgi:ABC-type glycerol-3-phosphate transport system substrate-binding protein
LRQILVALAGAALLAGCGGTSHPSATTERPPQVITVTGGTLGPKHEEASSERGLEYPMETR